MRQEKKWSKIRYKRFTITNTIKPASFLVAGFFNDLPLITPRN